MSTVKLASINDFISPAPLCIKPLIDEKKAAAAAAAAAAKAAATPPTTTTATATATAAGVGDVKVPTASVSDKKVSDLLLNNPQYSSVGDRYRVVFCLLVYDCVGCRSIGGA